MSGQRQDKDVAGRMYCPRCHIVYWILTSIEEAMKFNSPLLYSAMADEIGDCPRCGGEVEILELSDYLRRILRENDEDWEPWRQ